MTMRRKSIAALALLAGLHAGTAEAALWCSQEDSHGSCLVCDFDDVDFTLAPGESKQPLACANMAADPRVSIVIGGTGTVVGTPPNDGLHSVINVRISGEGWGRYRYRHSYGYGLSAGPNTPTMPIGPRTIGIGRSRLGETIAPVFSLNRCRSGDYGPRACDFTVSGRICVRGLC